MFHVLFFGAFLLANLINANTNLTCYECNSCSSTPEKIPTGNKICFRVQVNCVAANIHIIALIGDRLHSNYSSSNCGQTFFYSSDCTIAYHCCYKNKCNTYENSLLTSSSSSLYILKRIVISYHILFIYYKFLSFKT